MSGYQTPLGDFNQNLQQLRQSQPVMQAVDFSSFNKDQILDTIRRFSQSDMTTHDTAIFVKNNIDIIVELGLANNGEIGQFATTSRFYEVYPNIMKSIPITPDRKLFANKLAYEFSIFRDNKKLEEIYNRVADDINTNSVNALVKLGLSPNTAKRLCRCRFSSSRESTNVKRLNFEMCRYTADIFTEQMVVWVYEQLFSRISTLFIHTMLEVYEDKQLDEYGEDFRDIYGNISLAILDILNNMPSKDITTVVMMYMDEYERFYQKTPVLPRFTLRAISYDYGRIVNVIDRLLAEGYNVP